MELHGGIAAIIQVFSTFNGLFTLRYNRINEQFVQVPWLRWYSYALHGTILFLLLPFFVFDIYDTSYTLHDKSYPYTMYTRIIYNAIIVWITVTTIAFSGWRQQRVLRICCKLKLLEYNYFRHLPKMPVLRYLKDMLYARLAIITIHSTMLFLTEVFSQLSLMSQAQTAWYTGVLTVCYVLLVCLLHGVSLHYFLILWYICEQYALINRRLEDLQKQASQIVVYDCSDELWRLHWAHTQLTRLVGELTDLYKYQIFAKLILYYTYLVATAYTIVVLVSRRVEVTYAAFTIEGVQNTLLVLDLYNFCALAEATMSFSKLIIQTLKRFAEVPHLHLKSEKAFEWFALELSWRPLRIILFDVLPINRYQAFFVVALIVQHTIILVQSDYKNL